MKGIKNRLYKLLNRILKPFINGKLLFEYYLYRNTGQPSPVHSICFFTSTEAPLSAML